MAYSITFIIPHRGRTEFLSKTLQSIFIQDYQVNYLSVIIITQDNADTIKKIIPSSKIKVDVIERPRSETISTLRNYGTKISDSDFFAFIDADIELSPNWATEMANTLNSHPECSLVSSTQSVGEICTKVEKIRVAAGFSQGDLYVKALSGHNLFLSRKSFDQVGGFPEHLETCEDYFFTTALGQIGKIFITDTTSYIHLGEDKSFKQVFKKEFWRSRSNFPSLKSRKVPLREYPSIALPFWFVITFLLAISGIVTLSIPVTLSALFLYFIPIVLYSFRLKKSSNFDIMFADILLFYFLYHTARAFGSLSGLPQFFKKSRHAKS